MKMLCPVSRSPLHGEEERNREEAADKHNDDPGGGQVGAEHQAGDGGAEDSRDAPLQTHPGIGPATNMFWSELVGQGWNCRCLDHLAYCKD